MLFLLDLHRKIESLLGARFYRLVRYLMSGGTAAVSHLFVFFMLVKFGHLHYLPATTIAFLLSVVVSFTMQKFWTFQDTHTFDLTPQFGRYCIVVLFNLALNNTLMYIFVEQLSVQHLIAQIVTIAIVATVGYLGYKHFVFRERATASA